MSKMDTRYNKPIYNSIKPEDWHLIVTATQIHQFRSRSITITQQLNPRELRNWLVHEHGFAEFDNIEFYDGHDDYLGTVVTY